MIPVAEDCVSYPADAQGDFGYVTVQPLSSVELHEGPSRLRQVSSRPAWLMTEAAVTSADGDDIPFIHTEYSLFGTPPIEFHHSTFPP